VTVHGNCLTTGGVLFAYRLASSAIALGALRAARRSGASVGEVLLVMYQALREMPGPRTEMTALAAH
jgi:hypothetical protein